jgi:hypothetical protein
MMCFCLNKKKIDKRGSHKILVGSLGLGHQTMNHLYVSGDYMWSLFIGHLAIEKLLKAFSIRTKDENYPMIHSLLRIAEKAGWDLMAKHFNPVLFFRLRLRTSRPAGR